MVFKDREEGKRKLGEVLKQHQNLVLKNAEYIIRPFRDWPEIEKEGRDLQHAIAYYATGCYAHGGDYLFVMRKAGELETPYISLEFSTEGELLLAKKIYNRPVEEESELAFIEQFRTRVLLPFILKGKGEVRVLLYKQILSTCEYRKLVHLPEQADMALSALKKQLDDEVDMDKDFWWCPLEDVSLMKLHGINRVLKTVIVTDGNEGVLCELPVECPDHAFIAI